MNSVGMVYISIAAGLGRSVRSNIVFAFPCYVPNVMRRRKNGVLMKENHWHSYNMLPYNRSEHPATGIPISCEHTFSDWFNERVGIKPFDAQQWGSLWFKYSEKQQPYKLPVFSVNWNESKAPLMIGIPAHRYLHLKRFRDEKSKENFAHMLTSSMHKHTINYI